MPLLAAQFQIAHRLLCGKDALHRVFQLLGYRLRQQLRQGAAQMAAEGNSGQVRKDLVDADKPATAVKKGQADGRVGQHRVQQRKRVIQARALLGQRGNHAVEGFDQVADLVMNDHRQREVAAALRRGHQRAGAAMQYRKRPGDGARHQQHQQHRGQQSR